MKMHLKKNEKGAAMMLTVVSFLFISLAVISGLVSPSLRQFRNASMSLNSKQAYFLAESGGEDVSYRIINNITVSDSEVLNLGDNSVTTTVTTVSGNNKQVSSLGDVSGYQRKVAVTLKTGAGVVFKYGTQSGQGGINFSNNAGLYGSLYSNGNVTGSNNAFITGDVYVANAPALSADQSNDSGTPSNNIVFANANSTQDFAQSFVLDNDGLVNKIQLYLKKVGSPANATVRIVTNNSGSPSTTNVATGTLNANLVTNNYGWIDVSFSSNPQMLAGVTYWFVVDSSTNASNYYTIGGNNIYANGQGKIGQYGSTWNNTSPSGLDGFFKIFLGGTYGVISGMRIGENGTGDAHAHTVNNNTIAGTAYCQTGSGNNKSCNTSLADPVQQDLPISDANIEKWKDDALLGGVINGDYSISGSQTLGPKKIIGNLTVNGTLTIADTIWVTGNLIINGTVKLDSSFSATTGILIADGYITTANNSVFQDSGTAGSYILLLSTSSCDSSIVGNPCGAHNAIEAGNNSDIIIANAQKGAISFSNNAGVKEMVGNRIYLSNNATVTYGSGLISVDFTSGPSGGWVIGGWEEKQ
jgi:hypothetical protein